MLLALFYGWSWDRVLCINGKSRAELPSTYDDRCPPLNPMECDPFLFQAVRAQVRRIARLQGATAEHFVDHGLHVAILVARMALLEGPPVITEDLLEGVFVDPLSVMCHGRWLYHTLPLGSTCLPSLPCAPPWSLERGTQGQHKKEILIRCT